MNTKIKTLATIAGAVVLSGASFFAGRESNKPEWRQTFYQGNSTRSVSCLNEDFDSTAGSGEKNE